MLCNHAPPPLQCRCLVVDASSLSIPRTPAFRPHSQPCSNLLDAFYRRLSTSVERLTAPSPCLHNSLLLLRAVCGVEEPSRKETGRPALMKNNPTHATGRRRETVRVYALRSGSHSGHSGLLSSSSS